MPILVKNDEYRVISDDDGMFFENGSGASIKTDELVVKVWMSAHQKDELTIYDELQKTSPVSTIYLEIVLKLLVTSGLLFDKENESLSTKDVSHEGESFDSLVSIVIVNYNGKHHLKELFETIDEQFYKNLETILVDNGSSDGSIDWTEEYWPDVKIVSNGKNNGFAKGNNIGINASKGEHIFLVNNDTKLEKDCIQKLVEMANERSKVGAVIPKLRLFDLPMFINAIGNRVSPSGWGSDNYIGHLDFGQFDNIEEVFSACFGAVLLGRSALEEVGLLDQVYRFYYEDSDWSYRARLKGLKIYFAPDAIVYHKFNASMNTRSYEFKLYLLIGNRIRFALKNLSPRTALGFTRNYLKEDIRNLLGALRRFHLVRMATYIKAWARVMIMLPGIFIQRRSIQRGRVMGIKDHDIFAISGNENNIPLIDKDSRPILDSRVVRKIYIHQLGDDFDREEAEVAN